MTKGMVKKISGDHFKEEIAHGLTLIDFYADWCGPCRMIAPILEELVQEVGKDVVIGKLNIDENPETPALLGVRSIPTLMVFKDGKMVGTKVGVQSISATFSGMPRWSAMRFPSQCRFALREKSSGCCSPSLKWTGCFNP